MSCKTGKFPRKEDQTHQKLAKNPASGYVESNKSMGIQAATTSSIADNSLPGTHGSDKKSQYSCRGWQKILAGYRI